MSDELIRLPGQSLRNLSPPRVRAFSIIGASISTAARMPDGDLLGLGSHLIVTPIEFATKMALEKQAA